MTRKFLFLLCFFVGSTVSCLAQADSSKWDTTGIPEKWKKESVVILKYDYSFNYDFSSYYTSSSKTTLRIVYYVRDKWGVEELSQIHLPAGAEPALWSRVGVVHKRNGTQIDITKDQLIPRKESLNFNRAGGRSGLSLESEIDQKLAVPSLEVGDILELHVEIPKSSAPDYVLLINKFPMRRFNARVSVTPNPNSVSTVQVEAMYVNTDIKASEFASSDWVIELENVDKYKDEVLSDTRKDLPYALIRLKAVGGVTNKKEDYSDVSFLNPAQKKDVHLYMARQVYQNRNHGEKQIANQIVAALAKKYPVVKDTVEYVKAAYYMYRELVAGENLFYGYESYDYKGDRFYVNALSRVLFKKKIRYKLFLSQPDHYSVPDRYERFIEPHYGIILPGHDLYLFNPLYSYDPENIPAYFEGQKFYAFSANKYYKKTKYFWYFWAFPVIPFNLVTGAATLPITLPLYAIQSATANKNRKFDFAEGEFPTVKQDANRVVNEIKVNNIDLKDHIVSCESQVSCYGKMKINESERICSASGYFLRSNNEYRKMALGSLKDLPVTEFDTLNLTKRMRIIAENDLYRDGYSLKKVNSHKIVEPNFFDASKPFVYSVAFEAKNMVSTFDDYMVFNAGSLIGRQLIVPEQTSEREHKFYTPYNKQLVNKISINVPEGYAVENLKEFNFKEETPAGLFSSEATVSGNTVMVTTTKVYRFRWVEQKDANNVYPFLRAAEKFYDKKMIFKKTGSGK